MDTKGWARRRQAVVIFGFFILFILLGVWFYSSYIYRAPTCFDGLQNGEEQGLDCGGSCVRICSASVTSPVVKWVQAFKIVDGQYNVVAYIENENLRAATPEIEYKLILSDDAGEITRREGTTILPPDNVYPVFEGRVMTGARVPTDVRVELSQPDLWLPVDEVRQQFTLVDRGEIVNADAAPRLQSSVRNNGLLTAKNVEVVTTIFDSQGTPLTASRTFADFPPEEVTDVIFTWPEPIAKTIRSCELPTDVILAVDLSGSMNNLGDNPPEPLTSVKNAAVAFANRLKQTDKIGLVSFATDGAMEIPLSAPSDSVRAGIGALAIDPAEERGSTNSGAAIRLAGQEFASARHNINARKVLVLLTDGLTNEPEPNPEATALAAAAAVKEAGVQIFTIGLGEDVNEAFLREVASEPENFHKSFSVDEIDNVYRMVTSAICEDGAARVDVIPKSNVNFTQWP